MRPVRLTTSLVAAAIMVVATLIIDAPGARAQASGQTPLAVAAALSPATGHLFALSTLGGGSEQPGASWVTTLDAKTGAVLHTVTIGTDFNALVVDDQTLHVFALTGASYAKAPTGRMVMLDAKTGSVVSKLQWGPGRTSGTLMSQLGELWVSVSPAGIPSGVLHAVSTLTGKELRHLPLASNVVGAGWHVSAGRIFLAQKDGTVLTYDLRTWVPGKRFRLKGTLPAYVLMFAAEQDSSLLIVSGKQHNIVSLLDALTGKYRWTVQVTKAPNVVSVAVDNTTHHAFAISMGKNGQNTGASRAAVTTIDMKSGKVVRAVWVAPGAYRAVMSPTNSRLFVLSLGAETRQGNPPIGVNGAVTTIDTRTGKIVRSVPIGLLGFQSAIDPQTQHLLVLSLRKVDKAGRIDQSSTRLHLLDLRTGKLLHTTTLPSIDLPDTSLVLDSANGRVYLPYMRTFTQTGAVNANTLTVVDTRTGALLPAIELPLEPER